MIGHMATPYAGQLRFVGRACGSGTCTVEIEDIDSADWECSPDTLALVVSRLPASNESVNVELLDAPHAGKAAVADLSIAQQHAHFKGTEPFGVPPS
jgi:hypothetical protein